METMMIQGVELILSQATQMDFKWVGNSEVKRQLEASWLILSEQDLPMNPRIIGKPGIGKTTLAYAVAREYTPEVYIFQCTVDTRPEDLLVTPVISSGQQIRYHASPLVTAMLKGGICILDEGNRMGEKSWASLAPLLDTRRYAESIVAGVKIPAHPNFRLAVTMNEDASTFDVPDYIQSRLQPQIEVGFPSPDEELEILQVNLPNAPEEVLRLVGEFLQRGHEENKAYTTRDGVNISRYAVKLMHLDQSLPTSDAVEQALVQVLDEAAHAFFVENCLEVPESVLQPLELLLLNATDRLQLSFDSQVLDELDPFESSEDFEASLQVEFEDPFDSDLDEDLDEAPEKPTPSALPKPVDNPVDKSKLQAPDLTQPKDKKTDPTSSDSPDKDQKKP